MTYTPKLDIVRRYFDALEAGRVDDAMTAFAPEVVQIELPNALKPKGDRRDLHQLRADAERGAQLLRWQRYAMKSALAEGDKLALEVDWEGELAVPLGSLAAGDKMRVQSAMFFEFAGDLIVRQTNYDCFLPSNG
jgi:ketosteroid isomerase-like protein